MPNASFIIQIEGHGRRRLETSLYTVERNNVLFHVSGQWLAKLFEPNMPVIPRTMGMSSAKHFGIQGGFFTIVADLFIQTSCLRAAAVTFKDTGPGAKLTIQGRSTAIVIFESFIFSGSFYASIAYL